MLKRKLILRKIQNKKNSAEFRTFSLLSILKSSIKFAYTYKKVFLSWCFANFVFLYTLSLIPNGWKNSLSILWLMAYYLFLCVFIRYIQQRIPYFSLIRVFNGLIPVSKIMFMNISIFLLLIIFQYVPMFMGFQYKYLDFFEKYMGVLQSYDGLPEKTLLYIFMALISPYTICRPYLAWISSLVGKSRSIMDAYKKTKGNYLKFLFCYILLSALFLVTYYIDTIFKLKVTVFVMSVWIIFANIVFINIYKIFYKRKSKQS